MEDYFFTEIDRHIRKGEFGQIVIRRREAGQGEDDIWREIVERIRHQLNDAFDHIKHTYLKKLGEPQYLVGLGTFIFHKISLCEADVQENSFYNPAREEVLSEFTHFHQRLVRELPSLLPSAQAVPVAAVPAQPQPGIMAAPPPARKAYKGFMYNNTDDTDKHIRLGRLKDRLRALGLIDDVRLTSFKRVFLEGDVQERVNWIGNVKQLRYFINRLLDADEPLLDSRIEKWQTTIACFSVKGKEISDSQLHYTTDPSAQNKRPVDAAIHELEWR